ncbi:MAG: hypothetical protein FJ253_08850 [Phycisphaerae bacterium]|nr:hypothetical protein [Phycisphaerae bacterium]
MYHAEGRDYLGDALDESRARGSSNARTASAPARGATTPAADVHHAEGHADALGEALDASREREAAASGAQKQRDAALSPNERRLRELNSPESPLFKAGATDEERSAALKELRELLAADPEAAAQRAEATTDELRAQLGLDSPKLRSAWAKENYSTDAEAVFLSGAVANAYDPALVGELRDWYVEAAQGRFFGEITNDAVAEFHRTFETRLSKAHRDELVDWAKRGFTGFERKGASR